VNVERGLVHGIDPVFLEIWGIELWYYGLAFTAGFLGIHLWTLRKRQPLGLSTSDVWDLSLTLVVTALLGGRLFDLVVYEWYLVEDDPWEFFRYWHGGMASHGVLVGGALGGLLFCLGRRRSFLAIADELVVPLSLFLALGRIGNHINGEVYGYVTAVPWAVQFPFAEGLRHPVALYESLKNLALIPILLAVRRLGPARRGLLFGHFVFWYGFLRVVVDHYRDYGSEVLGVGRGQYYNLLMALVGVGLILWSRKRVPDPTNLPALRASESSTAPPLAWETLLKSLVFAALLLFCLTIPGGWSGEGLRRLLASPVVSP
jgi:phosphatidylglycerol:prolipoprotein diacylglycerol transferase